MHLGNFKINSLCIIGFKITSFDVPLLRCLCVSLGPSYSVCLFTVLELYLFCVCFSNGLHHSLVPVLPLLVHSCLNDVENSIINPHSCFTLFRYLLSVWLSGNANETALLQHALLFFHFRPIKNANFDRTRPLRQVFYPKKKISLYFVSSFDSNWTFSIFFPQ